MTQNTVHLTPDERRVLGLTDGSRTIGEIAAELGISPRMAKYHSDMLRAKAGVQHRRQLIAKREELLK